MRPAHLGASQSSPPKAQDFNSWTRDVAKTNYLVPTPMQIDRYLRGHPLGTSWLGEVLDQHLIYSPQSIRRLFRSILNSSHKANDLHL
jgi:hypothetical protein